MVDSVFPLSIIFFIVIERFCLKSQNLAGNTLYLNSWGSFMKKQLLSAQCSCAECKALKSVWTTLDFCVENKACVHVFYLVKLGCMPSEECFKG